VPNT
jgi:hypothetical protein